MAPEVPWRYRRFWRLFRREKPSLIDVTYSYEYMMRFPRLPITIPVVAPTLMSYRWHDDDDYELLPKKVLRNINHQPPQHFRRRISKRYSDIVGPTSNKIYLPRKESLIPLSPSKHPRPTFKRNLNDGIYVINSSHKKTHDIRSSFTKTKKSDQINITRRYHTNKNKHVSTTNAIDLLAHRMQAAMSSELMHSLDRNFVLNEKKMLNQPISSSHHHLIPRVQSSLTDEQKSISSDEPTPDYDEPAGEEEEEEVEGIDEILIRPINNTETDEEPTVDYDLDDNKKPFRTPELEEKSSTHYNLEQTSTSCIFPQTSLISNSEEHSSIPPNPPPLPNSFIEQKTLTFRCRTIADKITPNHKLILKDEKEHKSDKISQSSDDQTKKLHHKPSIDSKPCHLRVSKELLEKTILRKVSHPVSRSYSTYGSISQINDHHHQSSTLYKNNNQQQTSSDCLSSSTTNSIIIENEYEHRTSTKIYNDYKRRTSLMNENSSQMNLIHPIHKHIGLRSSTSSSSTNEKGNEIILSNKQMNVCVINQLNQHLSTRINKQQDLCLKKKEVQEKTNVYDEPQTIQISKSLDVISSSVPPPPPPLPVGGFRPVSSQLNRPLSSQRSSIMTLPREMSSIDRASSTGTSTTSSKLSDTRILRELRSNPLFTKAKQHLEIEPSNYYKNEQSLTEINETFLIDSNELNSIIKTKRINTIDSKILCRQSELELIFQKRAQRTEQNLT